MSDRNALIKAMHDERIATMTQRADCWACEAGRSQTLLDLVEALRRAQAASSHANAVLERAVPDEEQLAELWRAHWREQLAAMRVTRDTEATP